MGVKCLVCPNKYGPLSIVTFHRFPKDSERFNKWVNICRRPDLLEKGPSFCYRSIKLCSEHFLKTDFINSRLNSVAVPSVFFRSDIELEQTRSLDIIPEVSIPSTSGIMANSVDINNLATKATEENFDDPHSTIEAPSFKYLFNAFYKVLSVEDKKLSVICQNCQRVVNGSTDSSENFLSHIKFKHNSLMQKVNEARKRHEVSKTKLFSGPTKKWSKEKAEKCILCKAVYIKNSQNKHVCYPVDPLKQNTCRSENVNLDTIELTKIQPKPATNLLITQTGVEKNNSSSSKSHHNVREADLGRLIELVELRQPLWNHHLSLKERLPKIKTMLWNEVYVEFQGAYTLDELNKSWQYLKQRFTREKHLKPSGSQGAKEQWTHLKSLAFLNDVYEHNKNTTCNMSNENDIDSPTAQQKRSPDSFNQVHPKRNKTNNDVGELIQNLKDTAPVCPPMEPIEKLDDIMVFTKMLTSRLILFKDVSTRLSVEDKILGLVTEEFKKIND